MARVAEDDMSGLNMLFDQDAPRFNVDKLIMSKVCLRVVYSAMEVQQLRRAGDGCALASISANSRWACNRQILSYCC